MPVGAYMVGKRNRNRDLFALANLIYRQLVQSHAYALVEVWLRKRN